MSTFDALKLLPRETRRQIVLLERQRRAQSVRYDGIVEFSTASRLEDAFQGTSGDFVRYLKEAIDDAFWKGYRRGGADPKEVSAEAAGTLANFREEQAAYARRAYRRVEMSEDAQINFQMWARAVDMAYALGRAEAAPDKMLTFTRRKKTKEACRTCMSLEGKRHSARYWQSRNLIPAPGAALDCGGYRCGHVLLDDDDEAFVPSWRKR